MKEVDDDMTDLTDDFTRAADKNQNSSNPAGGFSSLFRQVLQSMNPAVCISGGGGGCINPLVDDDEGIDYDYTIIPIIKNLRKEGKSRTIALQRLFKLTDKESQQHRVPIVCSKSFDVMTALLPCLSPVASGIDRRQALLLLNNFCIPKENKQHMLLGEARDSLLNSLLLIFQKRLPEAHIAAACLYNLSFLEQAKIMLISYMPEDSLNRVGSARSSYSFHSPTTKENSLLRIIEEMVIHFSPYMSKAYQKKVSTVEVATVRWAMAVMRNLVTVQENAAIIASTTKFPQLAAQYLQESSRKMEHWTVDSLEDSSLLFLLMLIQSGDDSCKAMDTKELRTALAKVSKLPGIHGVRAGVIIQRMDEVAAASNSQEDELTKKKEYELHTLASF